MEEEIIPTVTLAELYEAQHELVDAVNVYNRIKQKHKAPEIEAKIEALTDIIFANITHDYADKISLIFNKEELRYFRIIPGQTVQIAGMNNSNQDARLDIATEIEKRTPINEPEENLVETEAIDQETSLSGSELEEIEKRLQQEPDLVLESLLSDKDSLKKEREDLLKKLETIEQKLKRLAKEDNP